MKPKRLSLNKPRPVVKQELSLIHKSGRAFQETKIPVTKENRPTRIGSIEIRKLN